MKTQIQITPEEKELLEIIKELDRIYSLDSKALPTPTNSKAVLKRIEKILELAKTNSLLYARITYKVLALGYSLILISHSLDNVASSISFFDPKSLLFLATDDDDKTSLFYLAKAVRKYLDLVIKEFRENGIEI